MSTVPETLVARHMGMEVLGISCVTNLAAGLGATPLSHEEVSETGRIVENRLAGLLKRLGATNRRKGGNGTVRRTGSARVAGNTPLLPFPPTVVGVAGCSGSGKTTLADEFARLMRGLRFHLDDYYLDLSDIPLAERVEKNFDDPALIEISLLAKHVAALAGGEEHRAPGV